MMKRFLALALLALSLGAGAAPALKAGVFEPPHLAPEFTLTATDGADLQLAKHRGKLVLLVFGFTHCPEVCPTTLASLAQARKALGAAAREVQVLYITVDPERDLVPHLRKYLAAFDPSFVGATAKPEVLAEVRKRYGAFATKLDLPGGSATGYGMNHSTSVYLIDRAGRLRALMPYGRPAQDYVHDLRLMLAAK